jgi:uncharacterized protein (TIGR03437 family)
MIGIRITLVRMTVLAALAAATAMAQPVITTVANAASGIVAGLPNSGIAQGSIFLVVGTGLGPDVLVTAPSPFQSGSLSNTSVSVTVNGITEAGLMYYTSATQVAALLPSATLAGIGNITVSYNNQTSQQFPITVVPNNLGIFTATANGQGTAIVTFLDYTLVSVSKAGNCGLPDTACGAANPGDTLTLWATGLGPITGSDASGAGLGVAMPNIPLKLYLGGVQANVIYQGRGCCIGEDQINFVVPPNVPTGCAVPLAVQIGTGSEISNYTVMPIAAVGSRTCTATNPALTPAVVQSLTTPAGSIIYGTMALNGVRLPVSVVAANSISQAAQPASNTDSFTAQFQRINVPISYQPFIASYADLPALGTCMVYNTLNGAPNPPFALLADLDSGPNISITGSNGTQMVTEMNEVYQGTLSANGSFLTPGNYTITSAGSTSIGPINAPLTIPAQPMFPLATASTPTSVAITRANGFTVTWTGGSANQIVTVSGLSAVTGTNSTGASFMCSTVASAGSITLPASVLLALPAAATTFTLSSGILPTAYSATGLNVGYVTATYGTPVPVMLQ